MAEPYQQIQVFTRKGELVSVRQLERFIGDHKTRPAPRSPDKNKPRVAVIGSGPAGLTAAAGLARKGYPVTVFESMSRPGGVLRYGYPEFRLPQAVVDRALDDVSSLGARFILNCFVGTTRGVEELLKQGFQAVYLATGAGLSKTLRVPGENLPGVMYGEEFLMKVNLMEACRSGSETDLGVGRNVVVIGAGNAAFDCARVCLRLGAAVKLIAKWTKDDFAVRAFIVEQAQEEGLEYELLASTVGFLPDQRGFLGKVRCRRYDYADAREDGKWELAEVPGSDFDIPADTAIVAIGHLANNLAVRNTGGVKTRKDGRIQTRKQSSMTDVEGVFAGGNVVDGPGPLVGALLSSRKAVEDIDRFLQGRD